MQGVPVSTGDGRKLLFRLLVSSQIADIADIQHFFGLKRATQTIIPGHLYFACYASSICQRWAVIFESFRANYG